MVAKRSISMSDELAAVLDELALRRGDDRSSLIETLLRENPLVREGIAVKRKDVWNDLSHLVGLRGEQMLGAFQASFASSKPDHKWVSDFMVAPAGISSLYSTERKSDATTRWRYAFDAGVKADDTECCSVCALHAWLHDVRPLLKPLDDDEVNVTRSPGSPKPSRPKEDHVRPTP